jgi:hypothetical protein
MDPRIIVGGLRFRKESFLESKNIEVTSEETCILESVLVRMRDDAIPGCRG